MILRIISYLFLTNEPPEWKQEVWGVRIYLPGTVVVHGVVDSTCICDVLCTYVYQYTKGQYLHEKIPWPYQGGTTLPFSGGFYGGDR